jgi:hypothetical protein
VADAPWRCSECGTINEPVANACRTCGRWPSLFDLEQSTIEADAPVVDDDEFAARTVDVEQLEPEVFDVGRASDEVEMPPEFEPEVEPETEPPKPLWRRLGSVIVPIGVVVYLLITALANRGG